MRSSVTVLEPLESRSSSMRRANSYADTAPTPVAIRARAIKPFE
jgi:hypothetical protein